MELIVTSKVFGEKKVLIDDSDYDLVNKYCWYLSQYKDSFYIVSGIYNKETKKSKRIYLHRLIMGFPNGKIVDHADNNPLNNKRANLRLTDKKGANAKNNSNIRIQKNNTSGYKGVTFDKKRNKYAAVITVNYKVVHGGRFEKAIDAAKRYNELALRYHGEFANLNKFDTDFIIQPIENTSVTLKGKNTTGYMGVYEHKTKWNTKTPFFAKIYFKGKQVYLGYFSNKLDAAKAYNKAVIERNLPLYKLNKV